MGKWIKFATYIATVACGCTLRVWPGEHSVFCPTHGWTHR